MLDYFISIIGASFLFVILPVVFVAVKTTSKGPVFYVRERLGLDGNTFKMIKFRTMVVDSDTKGLRTEQGDPRITLPGRIMRKLYIDEMPQFLNVIKGEMSIVGPRPEFPELSEKLQQTNSDFSQRLVTKPGITGYTQILYPHAHNDAMAIQRLKYDIDYIQKANLLLDIKICFDTFKRLMKMKGA